MKSKDSEKPLITVIIPARGRVELVSQSLDSISRENNYRKFQVIVVEDDPKRELARLLAKKYQWVTFLKNTDDEGPGGARNTGIKYAKGRYVSFLDSDDLWLPGFATQNTRILMESNAAAVVCFSKPFFDGYFSVREKLKLIFLCFVRDVVLTMSYFFNDSRLPMTAFYLPQISHMVFKKDIVKKLHFNYRYRRGGEDWSYFAHVMEIGDIIINPRRLLRFRYSMGSSTMQPINRKMKWDSYQKVLDDLPNEYKNGLLYFLFLKYMKLGGNNAI